MFVALCSTNTKRKQTSNPSIATSTTHRSRRTNPSSSPGTHSSSVLRVRRALTLVYESLDPIQVPPTRLLRLLERLRVFAIRHAAPVLPATPPGRNDKLSKTCVPCCDFLRTQGTPLNLYSPGQKYPTVEYFPSPEYILRRIHRTFSGG